MDRRPRRNRRIETLTDRIVFAYRGDFAGTAAIQWLSETYRAAVVTLPLDLAQRRDPAEARDRALAAGAVRAHVLDVRDEFARECVLPALRRPGPREAYADVVALAWPLIAKKLVEVADIESASAIAHGSTSTHA